MTEEQEYSFREWWDLVGSGLAPLPHEDQEEHAERVARRTYMAVLEGDL